MKRNKQKIVKSHISGLNNIIKKQIISIKNTIDEQNRKLYINYSKDSLNEKQKYINNLKRHLKTVELKSIKLKSILINL